MRFTIKSNQIKSNQEEERGKPEYPEKNLSEQSRESNPGHIGGRRVLYHCANPAPYYM